MSHTEYELSKLLKVMEENKLSMDQVIDRVQSLKLLVVKELDLPVDYSRTFQERLNAGNYSDISSKITEEKFPYPYQFKDRKITVSAKLVCYNCYASGRDVEDGIKKIGCRFSMLAELLALGEMYPELQKEFSIVAAGLIYPEFKKGAPGSSFGYSEHHKLPVLHSHNNRRGVSLVSPPPIWPASAHFLVVSQKGGGFLNFR